MEKHVSLVITTLCLLPFIFAVSCTDGTTPNTATPADAVLEAIKGFESDVSGAKTKADIQTALDKVGAQVATSGDYLKTLSADSPIAKSIMSAGKAALEKGLTKAEELGVSVDEFKTMATNAGLGDFFQLGCVENYTRPLLGAVFSNLQSEVRVDGETGTQRVDIIARALRVGCVFPPCGVVVPGNSDHAPQKKTRDRRVSRFVESR